MLDSMISLAATAAQTGAVQSAEAAAAAVPPAQKALVYAAAFTPIAIAAIGSAWGAGAASCSAVGAWKKCYLQNKPAPFQLLIFGGAPLSQTIYGMIIMFFIMGAKVTMDNWYVYMVTGILSGIAMGISAICQGYAAAASADAFAETGKGFANQLMLLGIIETIAIFIMAFSLVLLNAFAG